MIHAVSYTVPVSSVPLLQDPPFVAGLLLLAIAAGYRLLRTLKVPLQQLTAAEKAALYVASGFGLLQYVPLLLGAVGALSPRTLWAGLALVAALLARDELRVLRSAWSVLARLRRTLPSGWARAILLVLAVALAVAFLRALSPPTDADGLGYHLTAPRRWLEAGSLCYLPTLLQTNLPMGVEMLYAIALGIWSDTAAKLIHFSMGTFALLAAFALGRRLRGPEVGVAAAALFVLAMPRLSVLPELTWAYVDLGVVLEVVCAALALLHWSRTGHRGWLVCAALCAGFAISFKLSAAVFALALAIVAGLARDRPARRALGTALLFLAGASGPVLPWLIRSWVLTGNPVWPVLSGVFPTRDWSSDAGTQWITEFRYYSWGVDRLAGLSLESRELLVQGAVILVAVVTACLVYGWRDREARGLTLVVGVSSALLMTQTGLYARYFLPLLPLVWLLVCLAAARLLETSRWAPALVLGVTALGAVSYVAESGPTEPSVGEAFAAATGNLSRTAYLERRAPGIRLLSAAAPLTHGRRVLNVGSLPLYYTDACSYILTGFDTPPLRTRDPQRLLEDLHREGIRYILLGAGARREERFVPWIRPFILAHGRPLIAQGDGILFQVEEPQRGRPETLGDREQPARPLRLNGILTLSLPKG